MTRPSAGLPATRAPRFHVGVDDGPRADLGKCSDVHPRKQGPADDSPTGSLMRGAASVCPYIAVISPLRSMCIVSLRLFDSDRGSSGSLTQSHSFPRPHRRDSRLGRIGALPRNGVRRDHVADRCGSGQPSAFTRRLGLVRVDHRVLPGHRLPVGDLDRLRRSLPEFGSRHGAARRGARAGFIRRPAPLPAGLGDASSLWSLQVRQLRRALHVVDPDGCRRHHGVGRQCVAARDPAPSSHGVCCFRPGLDHRRLGARDVALRRE